MRSLLFVVLAACLPSASSAQSRIFDGERIQIGTGADSLYTGSAGANGFWLGDVDANGMSDIVTTRKIYLRDAQGVFGAGIPYALGNFGLVLSEGVVDVDGDGRSDLVYAHDGFQPTYAAQLAVRISNGAGGFSSTAYYPLPLNGYPATLVVGDLTLDGKPEILVYNWFAGVISVFVNSGTGSFAPAVNTSPVSLQFMVAELTGDLMPDLVLYLGAQVQILPGNGAGAFGPAIMITVPAPGAVFQGSVRAADVNGDGQNDLVGSYVDGTLDVRFGNGLGGFSAPSLTTLPPGSQDLRIGDLDLDGHADVLLTNPAGGAVVTLRGDGLGGFGAPRLYRAGGVGRSVHFEDIDSDGDPDFVAATSDFQITLLEGDGLGGFDSRSPADQGPVGAAADIALSDFDGDGFVDAAVATSSSLSWRRGDGTGRFGIPTIAHAGFIGLTAAGDLDADGDQDLTLVQSSTMRALSNDGTGGFLLTASIGLGASPVMLVMADMDLDGKSDAVALSTSPASLLVARGTAGGGFAPLLTYPTGANSSSFAVGDITSDGWPDVVIANVTNVVVMLGNGAGGLMAPVSLALGAASKVWLFDMDGDGRLDLVTRTSPSIFALRRGTGPASFGSPTAMSTGSVFSTLALGDVNGDGIGDVCCAMASAAVTFLPGLAAGQFGAPRLFGAGADPIAIKLIDLNLDGRLDVVTANNGSTSNPLGSVSVLLNHAGDPEAPRPFCFGSGSTSSCPCGNGGGLARGCGNTGSALGARLVGTGLSRISNDTFVLACSDYPTGAGVYFRGSSSAAAGVPFGAGLICAGGSLVRIGIVPAAAGTGVQASTYPASPPNDVALSIAGAALPGSVHAYQFLFREPCPGLCAGGSVNLSNAVEATWAP